MHDEVLLTWKWLTFAYQWEAVNEFLGLVSLGAQLSLYLLNCPHLNPQCFSFTPSILLSITPWRTQQMVV